MSQHEDAAESDRTGRPVRHESRRVVAIDAFRGFVLLGAFVSVAHTAALQRMPPSPVRDALLAPLRHSEWHGCTFIDLGFPAFIMLIAMSIVLSFDRRLRAGQTRAELCQRLLVRSAMLFVFATIYHGGISVPLDEMRFTRVFHRLAVAILLSGLAELTLSGAGTIVALVVVLGGYWGLMELVPVPGHGAGAYSAEGNLNQYVDRVLLGSETYFVLSTLGVAGTCLAGVLGGRLLLGERTPQQRLSFFLGASLVLINLGMLFDAICPINKHIWSPSFVLYSSGWIGVIFSGFLLATDVPGWTRWTVPLQVLGRNPLVAFASIDLIPWSRYADLFAGDGLDPLLGAAQPVIQANAQLVLWWLVMYWLYRNDLVIRI